jgi:hypothetical protein
LYFVEESKEKFWLGFLPQEGFPGYTCVLSVIVSLSVILIYARCIGMLVVCCKFLNLPTCISFSTKLEGPDNFRAWKYKISLVLEENDLSDYVMEEVAEPEEEEAKGKYKKNLIRAKRIIADSIKDHLIPHVSSLKTPKEMFDALSHLYEGRNINMKMALRTQLKNVKMQKSESIHAFFTRISQINEQIIAIGDSVEEAELVMTTLNGLPKS